MLEIILKGRQFSKENTKKALLFYKAIAHFYHLKRGAERSDLSKYFRKNGIVYSPDEISRFLQYLKDSGLIINRDKDTWVNLF